MKAIIYTIQGRKKAELTQLPKVFETPLRPDVIKRAVLAEQSWKRQPKGVSPLAGRLVSVENWGPGRGVARVPRMKGSHTPSAQRAAFIPMARGGHKAHPPHAEKKIIEKINRKEHLLALKSAIAYTAKKEYVAKRGHRFDENLSFPIIIETKAEEIKKTRDALQMLQNVGVGRDLIRAKLGIHIRAGKGKLRGRRYKKPIGPLIVVGDTGCNLIKAANNIPGVTVAPVKRLNTELLAPGTHPARLTVWTEGAINILNELFR